MTNNNLASVFTDFLSAEGLENKKVLLMISGGVDSMVLLDVAQKLMAPEQIAVFHLDHQVRNNSQEDFIFVQKNCSKHGIKFYGTTLQLDCGSEATWRTARQTESAKAATDFEAARILTGHHATDLVETMIFRLSKGAGPNGLSPFNTKTKPFWRIPKSEIIAYAKTHNLEWHSDPTNEDTKYRRNLIRKEILPALREITPNLEKVFVQESQLFDEVDQFLQKSTPAIDKPLPLKEFLTLDPAIQKTWLRQISGTIPSLSEIDDCRKWLHGSPEGKTQKKIGHKTLIILHKNIHCLN